MASYIEIINLIETTAENLGYEFVISDGFEINKQSNDFKRNKIYVIRDVGNRQSTNLIPDVIKNNYNQSIWFLKNFEKDENQEQLDSLHSELKQALDQFMFQLNKDLALKAANITGYNDSGFKSTNNYFYGINATFTIGTQCNI